MFSEVLGPHLCLDVPQNVDFQPWLGGQKVSAMKASTSWPDLKFNQWSCKMTIGVYKWLNYLYNSKSKHTHNLFFGKKYLILKNAGWKKFWCLSQ